MAIHVFEKFGAKGLVGIVSLPPSSKAPRVRTKTTLIDLSQCRWTLQSSGGNHKLKLISISITTLRYTFIFTVVEKMSFYLSTNFQHLRRKRNVSTRSTVTWTISILMTSHKTRVLVIWKRTLDVFQTVNVWENWHIDRIFLFLAVRKVSSSFIHTLMLYASKAKIENSSKNYEQIFLYLCQLKLFGCLLCFPRTMKINRAETKKRCVEVTSVKKHKLSISIGSSCHSNNI